MAKLNGVVLSVALAAAAGTASAAPSTVAGLYATGAGMYTITGTITNVIDVYNPQTGAAKNTFIVSDGTGSAIAYSIAQSTYTATAGDAVSFTATNTPYPSGTTFPEFVNTGFTLNSKVGATVTPSPTIVTTAQLGAATAPLAESYVELDDVTLPANTTTLAAKAAYTVTDATGGTATMYTYTSYSTVSAAVTAANANPSVLAGPVNIIGYATPFTPTGSTTPVLEIYPEAITAFVSAPEPASLGLLGSGVLLLSRRRQA